METKRYLLACLGGFVGGLIASLPWLTLYTMGGLIVAVLAFLIAPGVNYGYRKLQGRVNRKLPTTIIVSSTLFRIMKQHHQFSIYLLDFDSNNSQ